jgi:hypothetical protein
MVCCCLTTPLCSAATVICGGFFMGRSFLPQLIIHKKAADIATSGSCYWWIGLKNPYQK